MTTFESIISVAWVINSPFEALSLTDCTGVIVWGWGVGVCDCSVSTYEVIALVSYDGEVIALCHCMVGT